MKKLFNRAPSTVDSSAPASGAAGSAATPSSASKDKDKEKEKEKDKGKATAASAAPARLARKTKLEDVLEDAEVLSPVLTAEPPLTSGRDLRRR